MRRHLQLGPRCLRRAGICLVLAAVIGVTVATGPRSSCLLPPVAASPLEAGVLAERSVALGAGAGGPISGPGLHYLVEQVESVGDWAGWKPRVLRRRHVLSAMHGGKALWREVRTQTFKRYSGTGACAGPPAAIVASLLSLAERSAGSSQGVAAKPRLAREALAFVAGPVVQFGQSAVHYDLSSPSPSAARPGGVCQRWECTVTSWRGTAGAVTVYDEKADGSLVYTSAALVYARVTADQVVAVEEAYEPAPTGGSGSPTRPGASRASIVRTTYTVYTSGGVLQEGPGEEITYHKPLSTLTGAMEPASGTVVQVDAPSEASPGSPFGGSVRMPWCYRLTVTEVRLVGPDGQCHRAPLRELSRDQRDPASREAVLTYRFGSTALTGAGQWQVSPVTIDGAVLPGAAVTVQAAIQSEPPTIEQGPAILAEPTPLVQPPKILAVGGTYRLAGSGLVEAGDGSSAPVVLLLSDARCRSLPASAYSDLQVVARLPADLPVEGRAGMALFQGGSAVSPISEVDLVQVTVTRSQQSVKVGQPFDLNVAVAGLDAEGRYVATLGLGGCLRTADGLRTVADVKVSGGRGSVSVVAVRSGSFTVWVSSVAEAQR